jgi:hypothetical protein
MSFLRWLFDEVLPNVIANWMADVFSPASMTGWAFALATIVWLVWNWHRRQRAAKKPGMASWPFIAVCIAIALLAVAGASYGLGLKFASATPEASAQAPPAPITAPVVVPLPPSKRTYLRVDAETLTATLRQMRDVLNESVRDSTTAPGYFQYYANRRQNMNTIPGRPRVSIKDDVPDILEHLKSAQEYHSKAVSDVMNIAAKAGSSYQNDLLPFIDALQPKEPTETIGDLFSGYRVYLHLLPKLNDSDANEATGILDDYNRKIAVAIYAQYKIRLTVMQQIDAQIREIQESQR